MGTAARIRRAVKETKEACKEQQLLRHSAAHNDGAGYPCWTRYDAPSIDVPHHKVEYDYDGCYDGTEAFTAFFHGSVPHHCKVDAKQNQREEVP